MTRPLARPLDVRPLRSPWRLPAAIGAIGEAVAHIPVTQEHLSEAPYIGAGFVLLTIAGLLLAQLLLTADSVAVWIATLGVAALGPVTLPGPPLRYDDRGRTEHTAPPVLGQHNESVRAWLDEMDDAARRR